MINKKLTLQDIGLSVFGLALLLLSSHLAAGFPPDDEWYAGGPLQYTGPGKISETWRGHPSNADIDLEGKKLTLIRQGNAWRLLVDDDLNDWVSKNIPLTDFNRGGVKFDRLDNSFDQWRWMNVNSVMIRENNVPKAHDICIGKPVHSGQIDPETDVIYISVIEKGCSCNGCEDHPGHSGAGR